MRDLLAALGSLQDDYGICEPSLARSGYSETSLAQILFIHIIYLRKYTRVYMYIHAVSLFPNPGYSIIIVITGCNIYEGGLMRPVCADCVYSLCVSIPAADGNVFSFTQLSFVPIPDATVLY